MHQSAGRSPCSDLVSREGCKTDYMRHRDKGNSRVWAFTQVSARGSVAAWSAAGYPRGADPLTVQDGLIHAARPL